MNIEIDLKKIAVSIVVAVVLASGFFAWQSGALQPVLALFSPETPEAIDPTQSPDAQLAAEAAVAFYTIDYQESPELWAERLCGFATESGCTIAKGLFAESIHALATAKNIQTTATAVPVSMTEHDEGNRVWLIQITVVNPWEGLETPTQDVYVDVSFDDASSSWRYNRILFEEETESK